MQVQKNILERAGVPQEKIQQLEIAWGAYKAAEARPIQRIPHIICTGIYNAGKSTLLNALTDSEQFPTGDIPMTKEIAEATYGGAVYVDTPGLNAEGADDRETAAAYETADLILFVSSAQNGGLLESEAKWLEQLQKRFLTAEELNKRLIYVLSQCGQVDEDRLPVIREKFEKDITSILGEKPQALFQTDALVYIQGNAQKEALLVEFSQVRELRNYLAERVERATGSLEADYQRQLELAKQNCLTAFGEVSEFCCQKYEDADTRLEQKKQELRKVWSGFLSGLEKILNDKPSPYISRHMDHPSYKSYNEVKDSSESGVKRKAADCLRSRYNDRESTLRRSVRKAKEDIASYLSKGPESIYWNKLNRVNQQFEAVILQLMQMGVSLERGADISVEPDLDSNFSSEIEQDLRDDVVRTSYYYSLEFYIQQECNISEWEEEVKGLFGISTRT